MRKFTSAEEASAHRYGRWAGNERGAAYKPERCAEEVPRDSRSPLYKQCTRKSGHGPAGLYCRQHAKRYTEDTP